MGTQVILNLISGEPPFIESISGFFSSSFMKKPKEEKKSTVDKKKTGINETNIKSYMKKFT